MKYYLILLIILLFGCDNDNEPKPLDEMKLNGYAIYLLFEVDECKMYKFYDESYWRYFSNCRGSVSSIEKSGKIHHEEKITTDKSREFEVWIKSHPGEAKYRGVSIFEERQ